MTALRIFRRACTHALASPGLVITLYLVNFLLAFPAFYFAYAVLQSALGNSLAGEALLSGFDDTVWHDLMRAQGFSFTITALLRYALPLAVLGAVAQTFLAGGVLDLLVREKRFSAATFFQACGTYLGQFFPIWVLTALILALVFLLFGVLLGSVLTMAAMQPDSDRAAGVGITILLTSLFFLLLLVFMASDYARVNAVVHGKQPSWKAMGRGFLFIFRNPASTLGLHFLLILLLGIVIVIYFALEGLTDTDSSSTIFLLFIVQQLFMVARAGIRVAFSAGEVALYEERKPRPVVFYGWDDSPWPQGR